jgi:hypothetical protein
MSPWYRWNIAELALNNKHSLTHSLTKYENTYKIVMIYKISKENTDTMSYIKRNTSHFKVKWVHDAQVNFDILGLCCLSSFGVLIYSNSATNCEFREYHSSVSLCLRRNYNM